MVQLDVTCFDAHHENTFAVLSVHKRQYLATPKTYGTGYDVEIELQKSLRKQDDGSRGNYQVYDDEFRRETGLGYKARPGRPANAENERKKNRGPATRASKRSTPKNQ